MFLQLIEIFHTILITNLGQLFCNSLQLGNLKNNFKNVFYKSKETPLQIEFPN